MLGPDPTFLAAEQLRAEGNDTVVEGNNDDMSRPALFDAVNGRLMELQQEVTDADEKLTPSS